jgi:hypothetical protein
MELHLLGRILEEDAKSDGPTRIVHAQPAACWWARMMELSIKAIDLGDLVRLSFKHLQKYTSPGPSIMDLV